MRAVREVRCMDTQPIGRLLQHGAGCLSVVELLTVAAGLDEEVAHRLVDALDGNGGAEVLERLRQTDAERLQVIAGVTPRRAAAVLAAVELGRRAYLQPTVRAVLDNPQAVAAALGADFAFCEVEQFAVLLLDVKNRLLARRVVSVGTLDQTLAYPRDVFREAVRVGAAGIVVAHNHPSGFTDPSPEDLCLTRQLIECGKTLQIPVLDHIIVCPYSWSSLRKTTSGLWRV